jgi:hypothetical protein
MEKIQILNKWLDKTTYILEEFKRMDEDLESLGELSTEAEKEIAMKILINLQGIGGYYEN